MKRPTAARLKKVTPENLEQLGAPFLAQLLHDVAETRPDLKRRLRMELAAHLGAEHLIPEIDKRLQTVETSRGKVTWRQKPAFLRDLEALRALSGERLAALEPAAAADRLWRFLATARATSARVAEPEAALADIYRRAASDLGRLLQGQDLDLGAHRLAELIISDTRHAASWLPSMLTDAPPRLAKLGLAILAPLPRDPLLTAVIRQLADATGDIETYRASFSQGALATPAAAVDLASRYMAQGNLAGARTALEAAAPRPRGLTRRVPEPDFAWESAWIDLLERSGEADAAQEMRWSSFRRTLDIGRAKAFVARLPDFSDAEAERAAFECAAEQQDFSRGLRFLMSWPALPEAAHMIEARATEAIIAPDDAELWASKLRRRFPDAALILLRRAAAAAFKRREFKTSDRLTSEAESISPS